MNRINKYLYLVPALCFVIPLLLAPIIFVIYSSFTKWDGLTPQVLIGFGNYIRFFNDAVFTRSFLNTLIWVVMILVFPMFFGLALAMILKNIWLSKGLKFVFFIPIAMSGTGIGLLWNWIYARQGLVNSILLNLNILDKPIDWLLSEPLNTFVMISAYSWQLVGTNMILFLMGLQNLPGEVIEAAKMDGASSWRTFKSIIFPLLRPTTTIVVILNIIGTFKIFDIIWLMTSGGPYRASETLAVTMYKEAFSISNMGYGSAIAVALSLIVFSIGIVYLKRTTSNED